MNNDKQILIDKFVERIKTDRFGEPNHFFLHAIFNTVDITDLIELFLSSQYAELRATLLNYLKKKFYDRSLDHTKLFKNLLKRRKKTADYYQGQRMRLLLFNLLPQLAKRYSQIYFDYFIESRYTHDIHSALEISNVIWNPAHDKELIERFKSTGMPQYLYSVLKNSKSEKTIDYILPLWNDYDLEHRTKNSIIRKYAANNFQKFAFLKKDEPEKYLYACAMTNQKMSSKEITALYSRLNKEQKSFGIWCIGKLNNWELLKKEITEYLQEKKLPAINIDSVKE